MSDDEIKSIWDKSDKTPLTEHTITDFSKFMQEIEETRKRGYAMDNEENDRMDEKRMKEIAEYALAMKKINL